MKEQKDDLPSGDANDGFLIYIALVILAIAAFILFQCAAYSSVYWAIIGAS